MFIHSRQCQPAALFQQATFPRWKNSSCSLKINLFLFMLSVGSCFKKSLDASCCCSMLNCETKKSFLKDKHHVTSMTQSVSIFFLNYSNTDKTGNLGCLDTMLMMPGWWVEASSRLVSIRQRKMCRKYYNKIRRPGTDAGSANHNLYDLGYVSWSIRAAFFNAI